MITRVKTIVHMSNPNLYGFRQRVRVVDKCVKPVSGERNVFDNKLHGREALLLQLALAYKLCPP